MRFTQLKNGEGIKRGVIDIIGAFSGTPKIIQHMQFHDENNFESKNEDAENGREPNIGLSDSPAK